MINVIIRIIAVHVPVDANGVSLPREYKTFDFDKPGEWPPMFSSLLQGTDKFEVIGHEVVYQESED